MKSTSMSKTPFGCGIGEVVTPRAVKENGACPQSGSVGESVERTFPMICMYM